MFEELLCSPDVLFKCAFQLFDTRGVGLISFGKYSKLKITQINLNYNHFVSRQLQGNYKSHYIESNDSIRF